MEGARQATGKIRFGPHEADLTSFELRKGGIKLRLQPQPFQVLSLLLSRPGEVVTREELKQELWPDDTYVDFDLSLNTVIKKLRRTLNDNPQHPRYIETLPRQGYRFVFPVEPILNQAPSAPPSEGEKRTGLRVIEKPLSAPAALPAGTGAPSPPETVVLSRTRRWVEIAAVVAASVFLLVAIFQGFSAEDSSPAGLVRRWSFSSQGATAVSVSPDGRQILYTVQSRGRRSLWLRSVDQETPRELPGTAGAIAGFWSPDSSTIGFGTFRNLKKLVLDGGEPIILCSLPGRSSNVFAGGTWSSDGEEIVFSSGALLFQVAATGGEPELLFEQKEEAHDGFRWPHFLPVDSGRRAIVFSAGANPWDRMVEVLDLDTGERRELAPGSAPVYSPTGHLLFGPSNTRRRGLSAQPFSLQTLSPTGPAVQLNDRAVGVSVSQGGTLVYWDNPAPVAVKQLVWRDRETGKILERVGSPQQSMFNPAVSPSGRQVAVVSAESGDLDVWIHDLSRSTRTRLTFDEAREDGPAWSPDGSKIAFWRRVAGRSSLVVKAAGGTGEEQVFYTAAGALVWPDWSRDGRYISFLNYERRGDGAIRYIDLRTASDASPPATYVASSSRDADPRFSPDGGFLAYEARELGRREIFIRSFPDRTRLLRKVSVSGGSRPRWRGDGAELYYVEGSVLMAVSVSRSNQGLVLGEPRRLFESTDLGGAYVPSEDGQKFLTMSPLEEPEAPAIRVVENWFQELRKADLSR